MKLTQNPLPKTIKISGKEYTHKVSGGKFGTQQSAQALRANGWLARVIDCNNGLYAVYARVSRKEERTG